MSRAFRPGFSALGDRPRPASGRGAPEALLRAGGRGRRRGGRGRRRRRAFAVDGLHVTVALVGRDGLLRDRDLDESARIAGLVADRHLLRSLLCLPLRLALLRGRRGRGGRRRRWGLLLRVALAAAVPGKGVRRRDAGDEERERDRLQLHLVSVAFMGFRAAFGTSVRGL